MNKIISKGIIIGEFVTLVGGGSAALAESPPKREMLHVQQEQHPPLDIGRFAIVATATGTTSVKITPHTGELSFGL